MTGIVRRYYRCSRPLCSSQATNGTRPPHPTPPRTPSEERRQDVYGRAGPRANRKNLFPQDPTACHDPSHQHRTVVPIPEANPENVLNRPATSRKRPHVDVPPLSNPTTTNGR
jgi:hypothetical protein